MEHVDRVGVRRNVDHPKRAGCVADADFPNTGSHGWYRLPIVWIFAVLNLVELEAGLAAGIRRKGAHVVPAASKP